MTVETYRSSPSEISRGVFRSPAKAQQLPWVPTHEPERASSGDDEDFARVINPVLPRWPRIFPSL